jgi:medium-chain acyl-[acyl-carrier-protein] hydrolase
MIEGAIYKSRETVKSFQIDFSRSLRPGALFELMQEAAYHHAESLGVGISDLETSQQIWVLSRAILIVDRYPQWGESIELRTWPKGVKGLFAMRDFDITGEDNKVIVRATTSWLIIDAKTRRPVRTIDALKAIESAGISAVDQFPDKLQNPSLESKKVFCADYTSIDVNRHVNNARYVDWITDSIDEARYGEGKMARLQINFNAEMGWGDQLELFYEEKERGMISFLGVNKTKENHAFQALVEWN